MLVWIDIYNTLLLFKIWQLLKTYILARILLIKGFILINDIADFLFILLEWDFLLNKLSL